MTPMAWFVFTDNFKHISQLVLVFLLLTWNMQFPGWALLVPWEDKSTSTFIQCFFGLFYQTADFRKG